MITLVFLTYINSPKETPTVLFGNDPVTYSRTSTHSDDDINYVVGNFDSKGLLTVGGQFHDFDRPELGITAMLKFKKA